MRVRPIPFGSTPNSLPLHAAIRAILLACLLAFSAPACTPQTARPDIDPARVSQEAAKQRELAARDFFLKENRLHTVSTRLLYANAELCGDRVSPLFGVRVFSLANVDKNWRAAWEAATGIGDKLAAVSVAQGSPAAAAGIQAGDVIVAVQGQTLPPGKAALEAYLKILSRQGNDLSPATFRLERAGRMLDVTVAPRLACAYPTVLKLDSEVNAYADGKRIVVQTGLMDFVPSDDELGLVIGHELAHNTMGHITAKQTNAALGGALGVVLGVATGVDMAQDLQQMGAQAFSQDFEFEADYVGLYYSARAGFDIEREPELWRRMAIQHPKSITRGSNHPPSAQRFVALEAAVQEVRAKQGVGAPLEPNMKGR